MLSGATCSKLGDYFGGVSGAAITVVRYNKIVKEMAGNKKLKRKVEKVKARIVNI